MEILSDLWSEFFILTINFLKEVYFLPKSRFLFIDILNVVVIIIPYYMIIRKLFIKQINFGKDYTYKMLILEF